jgi:hypothetical protein
MFYLTQVRQTGNVPGSGGTQLHLAHYICDGNSAGTAKMAQRAGRAAVQIAGATFQRFTDFGNA